MSLTREMIASLRRRLDASAPMGPAPEPTAVTPPPRRVFPNPRSGHKSPFAKAAEAHTTAMVGIGRVGTRYATDVVLQFQAELAVAHEAVHTVLPASWSARQGIIGLQSRAADHTEYLLRPDRGRRLDDSSVALLKSQGRQGVDVQPILADGLSAVACMGSGVTLLRAFIAACEARGLTVGAPVCARFARVWLQDEIGQLTGAKVAAMMLGERPGLGTGDGLSAYLVYEPRVGRTDGDRNMLSNIHARGVPPEEAAERMAKLAEGMMKQRTSGVDLNLDGLGVSAGYRAPQPRKRLVALGGAP